VLAAKLSVLPSIRRVKKGEPPLLKPWSGVGLTTTRPIFLVPPQLLPIAALALAKRPAARLLGLSRSPSKAAPSPPFAVMLPIGVPVAPGIGTTAPAPRREAPPVLKSGQLETLANVGFWTVASVGSTSTGAP
jgi:hypothetical protein